MAFKFFMIPVRDSAAAEAELNVFLRSHRVLCADRRWVDQAENSFWSICIDYLESSSSGSSTSSTGKTRVDYKEILSPEDFAVFAKLRDLRKQIAAEEAVPVYTIFTNEQLAQVVQLRATSKATLQRVDGIGEAKISKYGSRFLELLSQQWNDNHEASGQPVAEDPGS